MSESTEQQVTAGVPQDTDVEQPLAEAPSDVEQAEAEPAQSTEAEVPPSAPTGSNLFSTEDVDELEDEDVDEEGQQGEVDEEEEEEEDQEDQAEEANDNDAENEDGEEVEAEESADGEGVSKKRKSDEVEADNADTPNPTANANTNSKRPKKKDPILTQAKAPIPKLPEFTRKDKTLEEILEMMDDEEFTPIIPDNVTEYYLSKNGFQTSNLKIKRLLALATQKFISDIATDAYEYSRIRSGTAVYNASNPQARARALFLAGQQNFTDENGGVVPGGTAVAGGAGGAAGGGASGANGGASGGGASNSTTSTATSGNANATATTTVGPGGNSTNQQNAKITLTMEDLSSALDEYGLNVNRPQFYR